MNNPIIVVGAGGEMGRAIVYGLAKLNHPIYIVETNKNTLLDAITFFDCNQVGVDRVAEELEHLSDVKDATVISAAPYWANQDIAKNCIELKRNYTDLGGNPAIDKEIEGYFNHGSKQSCFVSLGLAPGLVGLILEHGIQTVSDVSNAVIKLRVGGLPISPNNILQYNQVFSLDGLYNEYVGPCDVIKDSKITKVAALEDVEDVEFLCDVNAKNFCTVEYLEAFNTKGGVGGLLPSLMARGVKECDYKTIRYSGHCKLIKFLLCDCKMDEDAFRTAIKNSCPKTRKDKVLISASIVNKNGHWIRRLCVEHDDVFTAMQKTTGFTAASVTSLMANGSVLSKPVLGCGDIPMRLFFDNLDKIGGINTKLIQ